MGCNCGKTSSRPSVSVITRPATAKTAPPMMVEPRLASDAASLEKKASRPERVRPED